MNFVKETNAIAQRSGLSLRSVTALLLTFISTPAAQTPITCRTGYPRTGDQTFVTCNFHKNINDSKHGINGFNVIHSTLNRVGDIEGPREALQCIWDKGVLKPVCVTSPDYKFDYRISDHLTLEISNATANVTGLYTCQVLPSEGFIAHACELTIIEFEDASTPGRTNASSANSTSDIDLGRSCKQTDNCAGETAALIAIACALLLVISAIVAFILLSKRPEGCFTVRMMRLKGESTEGKQCATPFLNQETQKNPGKDVYVQTDGAYLPTTETRSTHIYQPVQNNHYNVYTQTNKVAIRCRAGGGMAVSFEKTDDETEDEVT